MSFQQLLAVANQALGTKYVWGGNDLKRGVDCSGFTKQVYAAIGIELPRVSNQQARAGQAVSADQAQPGDLVWWDLGSRNDGADHIGIYLGNGMAMEASSSQGKVVVRKLWGRPNFTRPQGAPPGGFTADSQGQPQPLPPATANVLAQLVDPNDQGETEATVGAYNFARLTIDRLQAVNDEGDPAIDLASDPAAVPNEASLPAPAEAFGLREGLGEVTEETTDVDRFRQQEGLG